MEFHEWEGETWKDLNEVPLSFMCNNVVFLRSHISHFRVLRMITWTTPHLWRSTNQNRTCELWRWRRRLWVGVKVNYDVLLCWGSSGWKSNQSFVVVQQDFWPFFCSFKKQLGRWWKNTNYSNSKIYSSWSDKKFSFFRLLTSFWCSRGQLSVIFEMKIHCWRNPHVTKSETSDKLKKLENSDSHHRNSNNLKNVNEWE